MPKFALIHFRKGSNGLDGVRINKYLSEQGICSRREADRLLEAGRISVNGRRAQTGQRVCAGDKLLIDGRAVDSGVGSSREPEPVVLAFNKPRGIVCSTVSQDDSVNIVDYIGYKTRIFPIGRLDKDSEGLILLTNIGEMVNAVNRSRNHHEKEYIVACSHKLTDDFIEKMSSGVVISVPARPGDRGYERDGRMFKNVKTAKCRVKKIDDKSFSIVLTQGLNRQIRRMCEALGYKVVRLRRVRIMNIHLGNLSEGRYRELGGSELAELKKLLKEQDVRSCKDALDAGDRA